MASKRAVQLLALRGAPRLSCGTTPRFASGAQSAFSSWTNTQSGIKTQCLSIQRRWHSAFPSDKRSKLYSFTDVLNLIEKPRGSTLLIDVREPSEYATNAIPTSINIPISSQPDALLLSGEEFEDRFGFAKPPVGKEVVFYCKAGVRSAAAAQLAKQAGYTEVGEYKGSWLDWERNGGPGTKGP